MLISKVKEVLVERGGGYSLHSPGLLPPKQTHALSCAKNMAFGGIKHFVLSFTRLEMKHFIQRVEFEEVMVSVAYRRAWPPITDPPKVVSPLRASSGDFAPFRHIVGESTQPRGEIINHPMNPGARRRIRILGDKSETLGAARRM